MSTFEIVIPHMNTPTTNPMAARCLQTIREYSSDYCVHWVQNGGRIPAMVQNELDRLEDRVVIQNDSNLGFVKAANMGLRETTAPYVVLMNNDTEARAGWLETLRHPLQWPVGICGPRTTSQLGWQGHVDGTGYLMLPETQTLAFFCVMFDRRVFSLLGYLDEDFGVGFGDDDWYCFQAHSAGIKIVLARDLVIPHHHRSTFRALYTQEQIRNLQRRALRVLNSKRGRLCTT